MNSYSFLPEHSLVLNKEELSGYWICNANYIRFTCKLFWKQFEIVSVLTENGLLLLALLSAACAGMANNSFLPRKIIAWRREAKQVMENSYLSPQT